MNSNPTRLETIDDIYERSAFYRYLALAGALLAWTFDGVEQGIYSIMSRPALTELIPGVSDGGGNIDAQVGMYFSWALAMWLWGAAAGGVIFGRWGDRYGRVRILTIAVITYSFFTGLSALSQHWTQFLACRFLGAMGLGGAWPLSVALMVETWPENRRSVLAGLMGAGANVGFLIASLYSGPMLAAGYNWRYVIGVGFVIGLSVIPLLFFIPEPTKWRLSKAKNQPSNLGELFSPQYRRSTIVGSLLSTVALLGTWGSFLWLATYVDQITANTDMALTGKSMAQKWQSYGQIFGGFMGGVLAGYMGNKKSWMFLCITAWASVFSLFWLNTAYSTQLLFMGSLAGLFVTAFFGWLPKYLPELYPTRIRATGQGFSFNIGRILAGFGVLCTGWIVNVFDGDYRTATMVMCSIYLVGLIVIVFAPNTGGKMISDEEDERTRLLMSDK